MSAYRRIWGGGGGGGETAYRRIGVLVWLLIGGGGWFRRIGVSRFSPLVACTLGSVFRV